MEKIGLDLIKEYIPECNYILMKQMYYFPDHQIALILSNDIKHNCYHDGIEEEIEDKLKFIMNNTSDIELREKLKIYFSDGCDYTDFDLSFSKLNDLTIFYPFEKGDVVITDNIEKYNEIGIVVESKDDYENRIKYFTNNSRRNQYSDIHFIYDNFTARINIFDKYAYLSHEHISPLFLRTIDINNGYGLSDDEFQDFIIKNSRLLKNDYFLTEDFFNVYDKLAKRRKEIK